MALPILDGNQSATTLSTILSGGQHIPAHTVVSLGTQAITDMRSAVSGSVVSISNFPATQTIDGTVTANTRNNGISNDPWVYIPRLTMSHPDLGNFVFDGYYRFDGVNQWGNANFNSGNVPYLTRVQQSDDYFFRLMVHDENNDAEIEMAVIDGSSPDFPTSMFASGGTLVSGSLTFNTEQRESYGVRVTNSVTIGNTVTIAGTVTANPTGTQTIAGSVTLGAGTAQIGSVTASISGTVPISISSVTVGNSITIGSLPAISGTVTVGQIQGYQHASTGTNGPFNADVMLVGEDIEAAYAAGLVVIPAAKNGGVLGGRTAQGDTPICVYGDNGSAVTISGTVTIGNSVTIASLPAISGTVTANSSNGSLTTRFGSVTTANAAFATSAVTNSNRKYLLIQNITTASNVITVGVGFTPTTTQGIQLTAGAGLTFEGNYIPTGAVNLLSSVTASCFTILEA